MGMKMTFFRETIFREWINRKSTYSVLLALLTALMLGGCAGSKAKLMDKDIPTLKQIYTEKMAGSQPIVRQERPLQDADGGMVGDTQQRFRQLNRQFPYLPNPVLMMYVFPHLTPAGTPIPGYSISNSIPPTQLPCLTKSAHRIKSNSCHEYFGKIIGQKISGDYS